MIRVWVYGTVMGEFAMSPIEAKLLIFQILTHGKRFHRVTTDGERIKLIEYEGVQYRCPPVKAENTTLDEIRIFEVKTGKRIM